jgi:hypothetical protein
MASAVASHPPMTVIMVMVMVDGSNGMDNTITRVRSIGTRFRLGFSQILFIIFVNTKNV